MGLERRAAVIHLIEEDVIRRPLRLDDIELSAARLVGDRMAGVVLCKTKKAPMQSGLTTNSGITTNAAGFPGCGMISSPQLKWP